MFNVKTAEELELENLSNFLEIRIFPNCRARSRNDCKPKPNPTHVREYISEWIIARNIFNKAERFSFSLDVDFMLESGRDACSCLLSTTGQENVLVRFDKEISQICLGENERERSQ